MRAVICGGLRHSSIDACANYHGVPRADIEEAIYSIGKLGDSAIRLGDECAVASDTPTVVHGDGPLLGSGYCVHRLGVYHGGRY